MLEQTDKVDKRLVNVDKNTLTLKEELPGWKNVTKGVPQRSTLRLAQFNIFICYFGTHKYSNNFLMTQSY